MDLIDDSVPFGGHYRTDSGQKDKIINISAMASDWDKIKSLLSQLGQDLGAQIGGHLKDSLMQVLSLFDRFETNNMNNDLIDVVIDHVDNISDNEFKSLLDEIDTESDEPGVSFATHVVAASQTSIPVKRGSETIPPSHAQNLISTTVAPEEEEELPQSQISAADAYAASPAADATENKTDVIENNLDAPDAENAANAANAAKTNSAADAAEPVEVTEAEQTAPADAVETKETAPAATDATDAPREDTSAAEAADASEAAPQTKKLSALDALRAQHKSKSRAETAVSAVSGALAAVKAALAPQDTDNSPASVLEAASRAEKAEKEQKEQNGDKKEKQENGSKKEPNYRIAMSVDEEIFSDYNGETVPSRIPLRLREYIERPFQRTPFANNPQIEWKYWNEFCIKREIIIEDESKSEQKGGDDSEMQSKSRSSIDRTKYGFGKVNLIADMSEDIPRNKALQSEWYDYVRFRLNFFENELKWILNPRTFKNLEFNRNKIGFFEANDHLVFGNFKKFKKIMINQLLQHSQISLKFFILWNAMLDLFAEFKFESTSEANEASESSPPKDASHDEAKEHGNQSEKKSTKLSAEDSLFWQVKAYFWKKFVFIKQRAVDSTSIGISKETESCLEELIDYSIQDISNPLVYQDIPYSGIEFYIFNRITFVMVNFLFLRNDATVTQFSELAGIFQFLWDFAVFSVCFPKHNDASNASSAGSGGSKAIESFYIKQYLQLTPYCYDVNNLRSFEYRIHSLVPVDIPLTYPSSSSSSSSPHPSFSLLDYCSLKSMLYYTKLLLTYDYNFNSRNSNGLTPYDIAKQTQNRKMLQLFIQYSQEPAALLERSRVSGLANGRLSNRLSGNVKNPNASHLEPNTRDELNFAKHASAQSNQSIDLNEDFSGATDTALLIKMGELDATLPSVRDAYFSFKNQKHFARYLLLNLGFCTGKALENPDDDFDEAARDNELFYDIGKFERFFALGKVNYAAASAGHEDAEHKALEKSLIQFSDSLINLINCRLPVDSTTLILVFELAQYLKSAKGDGALLQRLKSTLETTFQECLNGAVEDAEQSDAEEKVDSAKTGGKTRGKAKLSTYALDYAWFKDYLLGSNVWLCELDVEDGETTELLFDAVATDTIESIFAKEQNYIWKCVKREEETENDDWDKLLGFKIYNKYSVTRQDMKEISGIRSNLSKNDLWPLLPLIDNNDDGGTYDIFEEVNNKTYLTRLLTLAHKIDPVFQNDVKNWFVKNVIEHGIACSYQRAPVKTREKAVAKAESDFPTAEFPNTASILDFVRCSVTFDDAYDLMTSLKKFINVIKSSRGGMGCIADIVVIKNDFQNVANWKSSQDCYVCTVTLNVLITDSTTNESMISEIVFYLRWMLEAKKIGYKLYNVLKRRDFIEKVNNIMIDNDYEYKNYRLKLESIVESSNKNMGYFIRELIWQPHLILSFIDKYGRPMLFRIGENNVKMFELMLSAMFHFGKNILGMKDTSNKFGKLFLKKYLNFDSLRLIVAADYFWGINVANVTNNGSLEYQMVQTVMESDFFSGLSQIPATFDGNIVNVCCESDFYDYFQLIIANLSKNKRIITYAFSNSAEVDEEDAVLPLLTLLASKHCNSQWLKMLLMNKVTLGETKIDNETLTKALLYIDDNELDGQYRDIIYSYAKQSEEYEYESSESDNASEVSSSESGSEKSSSSVSSDDDDEDEE